MTDERNDVRYKSAIVSSLGQEAEATSYNTQERVCPSCGQDNVTSARFCAECGKSLLTPANCPECNAATVPGADICEACGTWLLLGQCKFCSAPIAEGQPFCGNCGSPTAGILCPGCGQLSFFDFCKSCATPLSSKAHELANAAASDPERQQLVSLLAKLHAAHTGVDKLATQVNVDTQFTQNVEDDAVHKMKLIRAALLASKTTQYQRATSKAIFSDEQKQHISLLEAQVVEERERIRLEDERRMQEQERIRQNAEQQRLEESKLLHEMQAQINREMSKFQGKTFSSNQEARRFFMNLVSGLPEEATRGITTTGLVWRCNAYDCEHPSPAECADPSRGGVWLISDQGS